jgi:hypothetical protein
MHRFRVFISYSSEDRACAQALADTLGEMGLAPTWDPQLVAGERFSAEIRGLIRRSHLFIALLSRHSAQRPWVHQETGYATGCGIPVIPIAIDDTLPDAFIRDLQAIRVRADDIGGIRRHLTPAELEHRVRHRSDFQPENFVLLETSEERTERIAESARAVMRLGGGRVRQRGSLTSFSLPRTRPVADNPRDVWKRRDGPRPRAHHIHQKLYDERMALGALAAAHGCSLMIRPRVRLQEIGDEALACRVRELRAFLVDRTAAKDVKVAVRDTDEAAPRNLLIVGDWFYAESRSAQPGLGYEHTFLTWHAPSVLRKLQEFDEEFDSLVGDRRVKPPALRASAVHALDAALAAAEQRVQLAQAPHPPVPA